MVSTLAINLTVTRTIQYLLPLAFLFSFLAFAGIREAKAADTYRQNGIVVIDHSTFITQGRWSSGKVGRIHVVNDSLHPEQKALNFITTRASKKRWAIQSLTHTQSNIRKGDLLLLSFRARATQTTDETGEGHLSVFVQNRGLKNEKMLRVTVSVGSKWKKIFLPFKANADRDAFHAELGFGAGFQPQTVEVSQVELLNFAQRVSIKDLPSTFNDYPGREMDAPWRSVAQTRIEKFRKTRLSIHIPNTSGVEVRVTQLRHAFPFGSAVSAHMLVGRGSDHDAYRSKVERLFNQVVFENDLKWANWEKNSKRFNQEQTLNALHWLKDRNFRVRGHVMVWPSFRNMPKRIRGMRGNPKALQNAVTHHIMDISRKTTGLVDEWDVLNEPFTHHDLMDILGKGIVPKWFKTAKEQNPDVPLILNDYGQLAAGGQLKTPHQVHFLQNVKHLLDQKTPLDGIGLQSHFGTNVTPPHILLKLLDRYGGISQVNRSHMPIQITEFDINAPDPSFQADYLRDFMTATFSHPAVKGIMMWGFWEKAHWRPQAALYNHDWSPRPHALVFENLIFKQWWSDVTVITNKSGKASTSVFKGCYQITVNTPDGKQNRVVINAIKSTTDITFDPLKKAWNQRSAPQQNVCMDPSSPSVQNTWKPKR